MKNFWLSPEGKVFYCADHSEKAAEIVMERYGYNPIFQDFKDALLSKGWMLYRNKTDLMEQGFVVDRYFKGPTQAQRDTIFDLTGENYSEDMNVWYPHFNYLNLYHKHINIHIFLFIVFIILRLISLLYGVFCIKDFHKSDSYKIHQT